MNKSGSSKPLIKSGWLRALLYLVTLFLLITVFLSFFIIGLYKGKFDATTFQSLSQKENLWILILLLFLLTLIVSYVFRRWVDRKPFISLGLDFNDHGSEAIAGGMLAIFIISASSLLLKATGNLKWMEIIFDPRTLFLAFGSTVLVAFYEELIFRGYILNNLMDSFPKWLALMISAILFMIFHWSSLGFFPLVNMLIMGLILGLNYIYTRNLWFSICFHIGWKFMVGPVLGFSGDESFQTLLQTDLKGDENITGGTSGLEGSVLLTAVSLLSLIALYLFLQKKLSPGSQPAPGRI
ncbi:MAG TPA: CPBP family intramembrane glutamic endopeptidase [Puia sp.]|nr:CPBP family intramembrane glutamic endopeptidase [Puia sp.]